MTAEISDEWPDILFVPKLDVKLANSGQEKTVSLNAVKATCLSRLSDSSATS